MLEDFCFDSPPPEQTGGLYIFTNRDASRVYYVGLSFDLARRLKRHTVPSFLESKSLDYKVGWMPYAGGLEFKETELIRELRPLLNTSKNHEPSSELRAEYVKHKFNGAIPCYVESRVDTLKAVASVGQGLIETREEYREYGLNFDDYVKSGKSGVSKTQAYSYIKLAENWDLVIKLGLQDAADKEVVKKSMRLSRVLLIIDWYKEQLTAGRPEEELTLERYWVENTNPPGPTRKELTEQVSNLVYALELERAEKELLKKRVEDLEKQLQQLQQKPSLQARLQALKANNAELFV